ncbi:hypothetical protein BCIN_02g09240 [Botrytis cinerea B05.10]|uniref:Uncharacterized protein n=2 Tax=Botryotinia fuckeliana TaxID=40559 RepID=A0A384JB65_BOTFB|nr:hypothetical protein BCIN_02g09240 [Botrytis cinerea B05.10]ATZ47667.1 hypothetical protein BCIN_02g09240 [Botrytis cinerea B05.10]CCD50708.1 hypothetical protein BofuT4_uP087710.1 [Botrytis cinerea T4]
MQFTVITIFSFIAIAIASPLQLAGRDVDDASTPSMTDAQGNVVSFDSANVNQAAKNSGM